MNTRAETARMFAIAFRKEHPGLVRETIINLDESPGRTYYEVPVLDNGDVGIQRNLGPGGSMQVTTGNILVYQTEGWVDFSVILPNMSTNDTFTAEELAIGESFALTGPETLLLWEDES